MERMGMIPGQEQRGYFHQANGHLTFDRKTAVRFANEFIIAQVLDNHRLYQCMLSAMKEGDVIDIHYALKTGEKDADGKDLLGHTVATLTDKDGNTRTLWDVDRSVAPTPHSHAVRAFNAYRDALAAHQEEPKPEHLPIPQDNPDDRPSASTISRALSPRNLFYSSSLMWYFVDMSSVSPAKDAASTAVDMELSKPLPAQDAIILAALMTAAIGSPPLVFGVMQSVDLGEMPATFRTGVDLARIHAPAPEEIIIVC